MHPSTTAAWRRGGAASRSDAALRQGSAIGWGQADLKRGKLSEKPKLR
ncbi:MAG: hypothetical protein J0M07_18755 [Anaerolineae bacterium]|jgi:hypothetical protein|nr:hypothetical protein [Anaerolineae bacterium]